MEDEFARFLSHPFKQLLIPKGFDSEIAVIHRIGIRKRAVLLKLRKPGDIMKKPDRFGKVDLLGNPAHAFGDGPGIGRNPNAVFEFELVHRVEFTIGAEPGDVLSKPFRKDF